MQAFYKYIFIYTVQLGCTIKRTKRILCALLVLTTILATSVILKPERVDLKEVRGTMQITSDKDTYILHQDNRCYLITPGKYRAEWHALSGGYKTGWRLGGFGPIDVTPYITPHCTTQLDDQSEAKQI